MPGIFPAPGAGPFHCHRPHSSDSEGHKVERTCSSPAPLRCPCMREPSPTVFTHTARYWSSAARSTASAQTHNPPLVRSAIAARTPARQYAHGVSGRLDSPLLTALTNHGPLDDDALARLLGVRRQSALSAAICMAHSGLVRRIKPRGGKWITR